MRLGIEMDAMSQEGALVEDTRVGKAPMAPNISSSKAGNQEPLPIRNDTERGPCSMYGLLGLY